VLQIMLMSLMFMETSGERTCWCHRKTRKGEECKGKLWRFNAAIAPRTAEHALDSGPE